MIIDARIADVDTAGRPTRTVRAQFGSKLLDALGIVGPGQREQVVYLRKMVDRYRNLMPIREKAVEIVREAGIPPKAKLAQAVAIGEWMRRNVYYVNEPEETFQTPLRTLRSGFGDCDDFTTLGASLCEGIGIPCQLVGIGVNAPGERLTHIFPRAIVRHGRRVLKVPLDATINYPMGTDPIRVAAARGDRVRVFAV